VPRRRKATLSALSVAITYAGQEQPDVKTIVERSVAANDKDFAAEPQFNYEEKDHVGKTVEDISSHHD
jgi:hypothetical protein